MPHTDTEWQDLWGEFFSSMEGVIGARTRAGPATQARNAAAAGAYPLLTVIRNAAPHVFPAIQLFQDPNHPYLEDTLFDELTAIAATNRSLGQLPRPSTVDLDSAIDDSETGKGSIEDLIGYLIG